MRAAKMTFTYLRTKLNKPMIRRGALTRASLIQKLDDGRDGRFVLLSAPAGYGKTTLVTQWLDTDAHPAIWVSIDQNDNRPDLFFNLLMEAIHARFEAFEPIPFPPQRDPTLLQGALRGLINDLSEIDTEFVIVLDDYQFISDKDIHKSLDYLIEGCPPNLLIVMTSRELPPFSLPRWRARGWLTEVTAADLRFDLDQSARFLRETMQISADDEVVQLINERVDGWVTGLQFTGLRLRGLTETAQILESLTHEQVDRYSADYLLTEVLEGEAANIQAFLLTTSLLDRMTAPLCNALLDIEDGQAILEDLEARNLFTQPLDHYREWYRYHPLMRDLLQAKLERSIAQDEIKQLHLKAAGWFKEKKLRDESIHHAIKGRDFDFAARLLSGLKLSDLWRDEGLSKVTGWIEELPEDYRIRYPVVGIAWIGTRIGRGDFQHSMATFQALEGKEEVMGEWHFIRASLRRNNGDVELALEDLQIAKNEMPANDPVMLMMTYFQLMFCYHTLGEMEFAEEIASEAAVFFNRLAPKNSFVESLLCWIQGVLRTVEGHFDEALAYYNQGLSYVKESDGQYKTWHGYLLSNQSHVYLWRDEFHKAERCLQTILKIGERSGNSDMIINAEVGLFDLAVARHDHNQVRISLAKLQAFARNSGILGLVEQFRQFEIISFLTLGEIGPALTWLEENDLDLKAELISKNRERYFVWASCQFAFLKTQPEDARSVQINALIKFCEKFVAHAEQKKGEFRILLMSRLLLAEVYDWIGAYDDADAVIRKALVQGERAKVVRPFREHKPLIERFIQRTGHPIIPILIKATIQGPAAPLSETASVTNEWGFDIELTPRERDILIALTEGLSNKEIESKLHISRNTVRTHLRNLYSKLDVTSRTQA
ncbi:MAG: LuxR C-terminal-related transcriptional regulator, partial [Chloroflexota bacterium]